MIRLPAMHRAPDPARGSNHEGRTTVFYDGRCPLCSREIAHYRKLKGARTLVWVDITSGEQLLAAHGLDPEVAMARLHVRDSDGIWHIGAYGFAELWSHLTGYRWLSLAARKLGLLPLLDRVYGHFAHWRSKTRCGDSRCLADTARGSARGHRALASRILSDAPSRQN